VGETQETSQPKIQIVASVPRQMPSDGVRSQAEHLVCGENTSSKLVSSIEINDFSQLLSLRSFVVCFSHHYFQNMSDWLPR
jgi:hypothetical protein